MKSFKPDVCPECDMHDGHRPDCSKVSNEMRAFMAKHIEDQKRDDQKKVEYYENRKDRIRNALRGRLAMLAMDTRLSDKERAVIRSLNEELCDTTLDVVALAMGAI